MARTTDNGEKRLLWKFLEWALAIFASGAVIATSINAWAVKDYLDFKHTSAKRWARERESDARRDEWIRWQAVVLKALAEQHGIAIPPAPEFPVLEPEP